MKKKRIIKSVFSFLTKNGFLLRKDSGTLSTTYLFTKRDNIFQKIIISDSYDIYLDLKIRGKDARLLLNYQWDKLNANDELNDVDNMVTEVRKVYRSLENRRMTNYDFRNIVSLYSETVKKNLDLILKK